MNPSADNARIDAVALLASISLFDGLSSEDRAGLARSLTSRSFSAGAKIFSQGDIGNAMYIVAAGDVNIYLPGEASRRVSLQDVSRGEYFGELSLFDEKPRSASAVATTDCVLLELKHATLEDYLRHRPRAAMAILRTVSGHLRETNTLLSSRAARNVEEEFDKNISWSERLADSVAELNGSWWFIGFLIVLTIVWCLGNNILMGRAPDPYPYQFFNLALGILISLQGPLIVMSQNRQSVKDRARALTDFNVNLKNEVNIETLLRELGEFRAEMAAAVVIPSNGKDGRAKNSEDDRA